MTENGGQSAPLTEAETSSKKRSFDPRIHPIETGAMVPDPVGMRVGHFCAGPLRRAARGTYHRTLPGR
jgi:hypothetical protein